MATAKLYNGARMTTATTGTGTITLGSAVSGFLTFAQAGVADGDTVSYSIKDGVQLEVGRGVYTSSGTTLTRSVLKSTNSNSAITLSGAAEVMITALAEDLYVSDTVPGGRLTLSSGVPVMASTVSGATTIYYTPYQHRVVPIYDGTRFWPTDIGGELSQATSDTTKSPAAVANNSNYDLFVWNDAGTIRCTRGPAWSSSTARGTGAGTTELERVAGILVNKIAITNGPAAQRGTYVGSVRSNGSAQINFIYGGSASGGTAGVLGVFNYYNRIALCTSVIDSGASYTTTTGSIRQARASAGNQISFLIGVAEENVQYAYTQRIDTVAATGAFGAFAVGFDDTTVFSRQSTLVAAIGTNASKTASTNSGVWESGLGWHTLSANEVSDGIQANTFNFNSQAQLALSMCL
jgi:hypothetical protein